MKLNIQVIIINIIFLTKNVMLQNVIVQLNIKMPITKI